MWIKILDIVLGNVNNEDKIMLTQEKKQMIQSLANETLNAAFECPVNGLSLPIDLVKITRYHDLDLVGVTFNESNISGALSRDQRKIYVKNSDSHARKRFTIAHEIGHYLLHNDDEEILYRRDTSLYNPAQEEKEKEANRFAANLLVPTELLRKYYVVEKNTYHLAELFGVSEEMMRYKMSSDL